MPATCEPSGTATQGQRSRKTRGFRRRIPLSPPLERTAQTGECSPTKTDGKKSEAWQVAAVAILLLVAGWLLFCHGCHSHEDNELRLAGSRLISR